MTTYDTETGEPAEEIRIELLGEEVDSWAGDVLGEVVSMVVVRHDEVVLLNPSGNAVGRGTRPRHPGAGLSVEPHETV